MLKKLKEYSNWAFHHNISRKISLIFLLFLISSILLTYIFYQSVSFIYTKKNLDRSLSQTLLSLRSNIVDMVEGADDNYNLLLKIGLDRLVYGSLDSREQRLNDNYIFTIVDSYTHIDAVYITDFDRHVYGIDKNGLKEPAVDSMREAPWFEQVLDAKGSYVLVNDAGGIFKKNYQSPFISLIRVINSLEAQKPIGFAIINIPTSSITSLFETVFQDVSTQMVLLDEEDNEIATSDNYKSIKSIEAILPNLCREQIYDSKVVHGDLLIGMYIPEYDWKLLGTFPMNAPAELKDTLITIFVLVLLGNGLLMLLCSVLVSKSIVKPIYRLIYAMRHVKDGVFSPVKIEHPENEIGMLQDNYNHMIEEIKNLLSRLVTEQKVKRKTELNALQEQIKPHFLYNTLDAIRCMTLTDEPMAVHNAIETLGSFYRKSLGKGGQVICVDEEISITKDYISLLTLRYESLFQISYDLDLSAYKYKVPKLFLQPLVENAVYHGIKPMGEEGEITLRIKTQLDELIFEIKDNGIGMPLPIIQQVLDKNWRNKGSIGLFGTLERLKIFYGEKFSVSIISQKHLGTTLILALPKIENMEGEKD